MYAILRQGGHQYRVSPGDVIQIEWIEKPKGEIIQFDDVLAVRAGNEFHIGEPIVAGAQVTARVRREGRGKKVLVFKYKRRKAFEKRRGHRQAFTEVEIREISLNGKALKASAE